MNKARTIIIDGVEIQTSLSAIELASLPQKYAELLTEKESLIKYLEDKIDMCDGYIETAKSDLEELKCTLFAGNGIRKLIEETEFSLKIYKDILERVKSGKYE